MELNILGKRGDLFLEVMSTRDLKRDEGHLPGPTWWIERPFESADVEYKDSLCTKLDRTADRDGTDEPTVKIVQSIDLNGWEKAGYRARCENGWNKSTRSEPLGCGPFDASGDAFECDAEVFESDVAERFFQKVAELLVRMQMGTVSNQCLELAYDRAREDASAGDVVPTRHEAFDCLGRRAGSDKCAVKGADARSNDEVRNHSMFEECLQHANFGRTEESTPSEDERGRLL